MEPTPKSELGESHRRIVSALLRSFEDMCGEIERWIDPAPGVLVSVQDPLGPTDRDRLRSLLARLLEELRRIGRELRLDVSPRSATRSINALLVEHLSLLEETSGSELRGYGELDGLARARLDREFARLHRLFDEMLLVVKPEPHAR